MLPRTEKNKLEFMVALIAEFAATYRIKQKQAFLQKHYDFMHTQSFEDVVEDLALICRRNGGQLA